MSAQPIHDVDPDDPMEILRVLPSDYHQQFLSEYAAAAEAARRPEGYRRLHELLRLWRLRAEAYSAPGYRERLTSVAEGESVHAEHVIPGWPIR